MDSEIELISGFAVCPNCSHTWVALVARQISGPSIGGIMLADRSIAVGEAPECPKCHAKGEMRGSS